jgi:hypothetical protein
MVESRSTDVTGPHHLRDDSVEKLALTPALSPGRGSFAAETVRRPWTELVALTASGYRYGAFGE